MNKIFDIWKLQGKWLIIAMRWNWQSSSTKVIVPNSITYCNRTPIFEWCVIRIGFKNEHQKDMYLYENWIVCSIAT